jgi:hypothetical protein
LYSKSICSWARKQNYVAEAKEFRQIAAMSEVLVKEFGEDPDDKGGMLLAQAVKQLSPSVQWMS